MSYLNEKGLELIKEFEGIRLKAYYDIADVLTIGYGHTNRAGGFKVYPNQTITENQATTILLQDLKKTEDEISRLIKVPVTDNQFSAMMSLVHNIGATGFARSTVLRRLNAGDTLGAAQAFLMWNKATINGKKQAVRGLTRRRKAEMDLFLSDEDGIQEDFTGGEVTGGEQKHIGKSKTNFLGGLTIAGVVAQLQTVVDLSPQMTQYIPWIILGAGIAIIANRVWEAYKGEH